MFIKSLTISSKDNIIRHLEFHNGMNMIVDMDPIVDDMTITGNNVGKTTVLKLIAFCLGGEGKDIYTDEENKKQVYKEVKDFLLTNEVLITLVLSDDLSNEEARTLTIERNFLSHNKNINMINGENYKKKYFVPELKDRIFPNCKYDKPTFKQLIAHNIRYKDLSINNTLKNLNAFTTDVEYEALYLWLLGCQFDQGENKNLLSTQLKQEKLFKKRIEKNQSKNRYVTSLGIIENEINELNNKKATLNINENFETDLKNLNRVKYQINKKSAEITRLEIRRDIINDAKVTMNNNISKIDFKQLELLYKESKEYMPKLQKTFEDLVNYHNKMIVEKVNFISKELPELIARIDNEKHYLTDLLTREKDLSIRISKSDSFKDLEKLISQLNDKYKLKGEYEGVLAQIDDAEDNIARLESELEAINNYLYSKEFESKLTRQINKFNQYFANISDELYGEKYALSYEIVKNTKTDKPVYKFSAFNINMSSGKKQGEIVCFDLAYILFADDENIPCLHFLLNDKKELMHDNQLIKATEFVNQHGIQMVVSILKDKLPRELKDDVNVVVELSQEDKLFRIEK